ncbi:radical SAM protein [archaeon]|jgi:radical SAM superfamily enzyme YgiQ (UPF0313 family)|nr:radical SAM protein [archaeon]MBT7102553.1 radical SAM protein [archaeon]
MDRQKEKNVEREKKKVMFVKPHLETDAVWDPIRTCPYIGAWYMTSGLKERGHDVKYLDEVTRNNGLENRTLFRRDMINGETTETPVETSYEDFQAQKMADYRSMTPESFVDKYSAFGEDGEISRTMVRTGNDLEDTLNDIGDMNPDVVGIPLIATANYIPATKLGRAIKDRFPDVKVVFGGQHISADPEGFLRDNDYVDQVVSGDAISAMTDIAEGRNNDKIVYGGFRNFDEFPLLDPSIIEGNDYPDEPIHTYPTDGRKSVDYMFSKGCFRRCDFCVAGSQEGNHVTPIDYDMVDEQLRIFKKNGIEELVIQDDAYLWDKNHVREHLPKLLGLMKKHGMYWQNNGGMEFEMMDDFVTEEILKYNSSGEGRATSLYVPFNPRTWNKGQSVSGTMSERYHANLDNLKKLKDAGVFVFTSGIIGTPEQTRETIDEDIEMNKKLIEEGYLSSALSLSATMLPATKWYDSNGHNIVDKEDYAGFSLFTTHHSTPHMSPRDIETSMIRWSQELDKVQTTYKWGTGFPSAENGSNQDLKRGDE